MYLARLQLQQPSKARFASQGQSWSDIQVQDFQIWPAVLGWCCCCCCCYCGFHWRLVQIRIHCTVTTGELVTINHATSSLWSAKVRDWIFPLQSRECTALLLLFPDEMCSVLISLLLLTWRYFTTCSSKSIHNTHYVLLFFYSSGHLFLISLLLIHSQLQVNQSFHFLII